MKEYIELLSGNDSILIENDERVSPQQLAIIKRNIILEYKTISDPTAMASYMSEENSKKNNRLEILLFQLCSNLISVKAFGDVRTILKDYGLRADSMSDKKVKEEVEARLKRALSIKKRDSIDEEDKTDEKMSPNELRNIYDRQTAHLMTYFKFQINIAEISATVYANMINQYNQEIKAKMSMLKN